MKKIRWIILIIGICIAPILGAGEERYQISMLPRHSPSEIMRRITPLACCLSERIKVPVIPVVERNYAEYEKRILSGDIQIGYENPSVYVRVSERHEVLAMALDNEGKDQFRGLIIVRKESEIASPVDLKNRKICIVSRSSTGGYLSPKLFLMEQGVDVETDCKVFEAVDNKQENVIFSVYTGEAEAGFIKESALTMADSYIPPGQIRVLTHTSWFPNYALSVDRSLPFSVKAAIKETLVRLKSSDPVLISLKIGGFRAATDDDYALVRKALKIE